MAACRCGGSATNSGGTVEDEMETMNTSDMQERKKAEEYFHQAPKNYNCAQSVLKAFQEEMGIEEAMIEDFMKMGGGRAPQGTCGALYAANILLEMKGIAPVDEQFAQVAGASTCKEIKGGSKFPCQECVRLAGELVEKSLS